MPNHCAQLPEGKSAKHVCKPPRDVRAESAMALSGKNVHYIDKNHILLHLQLDGALTLPEYMKFTLFSGVNYMD